MYIHKQSQIQLFKGAYHSFHQKNTYFRIWILNNFFQREIWCQTKQNIDYYFSQHFFGEKLILTELSCVIAQKPSYILSKDIFNYLKLQILINFNRTQHTDFNKNVNNIYALWQFVNLCQNVHLKRWTNCLKARYLIELHQIKMLIEIHFFFQMQKYINFYQGLQAIVYKNI